MANGLPELRQMIEAERHRLRLSLRAAAMYIGITHPALVRIIEGDSQPNPETCLKLAQWLRIPVPRALDLAGHRDLADVCREPQPEISEAAQEIARLYDSLREPAHRELVIQQLGWLAAAEISEAKGTYPFPDPTVKTLRDDTPEDTSSQDEE
jgi:transcriptional regulator with XRE-family HTH domain